MVALDHRLEIELHVVAQIVEAELVVRAVGDVAARRLAWRSRSPCVVLDDADREAEELVEPAHPLGVAAGQVVVDGDDVNAAAGERIEVERSVATSVLPSPVFISAILPWCRRCRR